MSILKWKKQNLFFENFFSPGTTEFGGEFKTWVIVVRFLCCFSPRIRWLRFLYETWFIEQTTRSIWFRFAGNQTLLCREGVHKKAFWKKHEKYVFNQFSRHDPGYRCVMKSGYLFYKAICWKLVNKEKEVRHHVRIVCHISAY